jgi:EAL domain-containing protein (putative c-di-GMP-specific phosphodiesterase class I)/FixJ family two-component response regulator
MRMNATAGSPERPPAYESVLVVEDSPLQREYTAQLCGELGFSRVEGASNGQEALAYLERHRPSLLIVDLEMPTIDGLQLLSQLRARGINIPIILASSRDAAIVQSAQHLGTALGLTVLGSALKPLSASKLRDVLRQQTVRQVFRTAPGEQPQVDEDSLRSAIEGGVLLAHFQPQIELSTGAVRGVEALARWPHPIAGILGADRFIPLAESRGLIHPLTLRVLNDAFLQLSQWNNQDLNLSLAVNLSPLLLTEPKLVEEICTLTEAYALEPGRVMFEVTETSLSDHTAALESLTRLRLRGFGVSLDDYGTGYSSMQQLAQIPFSELKIDKCFVRGVAQSENLQVMLRSAVAMSKELGLTTVAEGVETVEDLEVVRACGCNYAQGWLFATALPAAELLVWLQSKSRRESSGNARVLCGMDRVCDV